MNARQICDKLRQTALLLRSKSTSLSDFIPLLQQAADTIEGHTSKGYLTVTKDDNGNIVAVTRTDDENRILEILSQSRGWKGKVGTKAMFIEYVPE